MKISKLRSLICGSALAFGASNLAAQEETRPPTTTPPSRANAYNQDAARASRMSGNAVRASQIIGSTVKASDAKLVGQVRDIVIDPQMGHIDFAVLSLTGTADTSSTAIPPSTPTPAAPATSPTSYSAATGGKLVPVPWQLFSQSFSGPSAVPSTPSSPLGAGTLGGTMTLTLNVDEATLRSAPSFEANNWAALQTSDFGQRSYAHFGLDWNSRMSGLGTAGLGVSRGVGTSSSDRLQPDRPPVEDIPLDPKNNPKDQPATPPDRK